MSAASRPPGGREAGAARSTRFDPPAGAVRQAVAGGLAEDAGVLGDITSTACIPAGDTARAAFVARDAGVIAGSACVAETFRQVDPGVVLDWRHADGDHVLSGTVIATVEGSTHSLLVAERIALNFLTHLSGVASLTARYVAAAGGLRVLDTRKTIPGLRALQRAAVRAGGGFNHRDSLSDQIMLKDNHLSVAGITSAVHHALQRFPGKSVIVECESAEQVREAIDAGASRVLLDNMEPDTVREMVAMIAGRVPVEISGGVSLDTIGAYATTGADFVSVGALTHSVAVLDIALDFEARPPGERRD